MTEVAASDKEEKSCSDCGSALGRRFWSFWEKNKYDCDASTCDALLCRACHNKHPLAVVDNKNPLVGQEKEKEEENLNDLSRAILKKYCKTCFQNQSTIDFDRTYDVIPVKENSDTTFVFLHGGSGSRAMFYGHASELNARFGHGSILLDLPGHGSMLETPLNLESCAETLGKVLKECGILSADTGTVKNKEKGKTVLVGGSLGAYIGFFLMDRFQDVFDAAILIDCGQNVGPGASYKAKMGLVLLSWLGRNFSNAFLMKMMLDVTKKSEADYKLIETCFGAGMFFEQAQAQVDCLRAVAPADYIPKVSFPILFMNGSKDYRDSEDKWLELCNNSLSELKVYEGGDHFFTHDTRFVEDILIRLDAFSKKIL